MKIRNTESIGRWSFRIIFYCDVNNKERQRISRIIYTWNCLYQSICDSAIRLCAGTGTSITNSKTDNIQLRWKKNIQLFWSLLLKN